MARFGSNGKAGFFFVFLRKSGTQLGASKLVRCPGTDSRKTKSAYANVCRSRSAEHRTDIRVSAGQFT